MEKTIQIRKNKKITDALRGIAVGESMVFKGAGDSVRTIAYRMGKEGYKFSITKRGITNGLKIERVQ